MRRATCASTRSTARALCADDGAQARVSRRGRPDPACERARGSEKKPVAHHVNCGVRWLNDKLCQATRDLVLRLEMHSRQTVLHYNAEFILDENEVPWFVGGKDVVTQRMPAVPPPKQGAEKHVAVNPTLQARTGLCMGDYCCLDLRKLAGLHRIGRARASSCAAARKKSSGGCSPSMAAAALWATW